MTGLDVLTTSLPGAPSPSSASSAEWHSRGYLPHRDRPGLLQSIRDAKHFAAAIDYIHQNPVSAGLVRQAEDWQWSSAREFEDAELRLGAPKNDTTRSLHT